MKRIKGFILYKGPSALTGEPIVCIATMATHNKKTGDMIQTWIIRSRIRPEKAAKDGKDAAVCGDCPLRPATEGLCYVNTGQAPLAVYSAFKRGSYVKLDLRLKAHRQAFAGRALRIGSYGEPTAIPIAVWDKLTPQVSGHTGYTHQWAKFPEFRRLVMASVHSEFEADCAQTSGWRTFRTRNADQPVMPGEVMCPASPEADNRRTCSTCLGCNGNASDSRTRRSFVIVGHGKKGIARMLTQFHNQVQ